MTQAATFTARPAPASITSGLPAGCYVAQVRAITAGEIGVIFATAETAPGDLDSWYECRGAGSFTFRVGAGLLPTWVRTDPALPDTATVAVARARTGA